MSNVITLPQKSVAPKALPRQRVFLCWIPVCRTHVLSGCSAVVPEEEGAGIWEEMVGDDHLR